jgi:hypothetical protein
MEPFYKLPFRKFVKKQTRAFQLSIEDEVQKIMSVPDLREAKIGDLVGFRVHKFSFGRKKFLIAYRLQREEMFFFTIGSHENFYRELKKYLQEVAWE